MKFRVRPFKWLDTLGFMPYRKVNDVDKLRRLLAAVMMIEADIELDELLRHCVEEARDLVNARYGALGVLNESRTALERFITVGLPEEAEDLIGNRPTGRGVLGLLITNPRPLRLRDLAADPDSYGVPANHPPMRSFLGVPVRVRNEVYGNLYLTEKIDADSFSDEDESLVEALALSAGVAIENNRLHDQVRILSVLDDRDRIARELHDRVIQRVFAVGMNLQKAARLDDQEKMVEVINDAVDRLDTTITDIRTAIYELGGAPLPGGLRRSVQELVTELTPMLGAQPEVIFEGPLDNTVPQHVADNVLAVLRETLTNAGKHAQATRYDVTLRADDELTLSVVDNGVGIGLQHSDASEHLGLRNLSNRAARLKGTFTIEAAPGGGTVATWRVPL